MWRGDAVLTVLELVQLERGTVGALPSPKGHFRRQVSEQGRERERERERERTRE